MFSSVFTYVQDIADPFFAYCKMHAEKMMSRAKRRNWLAIQSHIRKHPEKKIEDEKEKVGSSRNLKYMIQFLHLSAFLRVRNILQTFSENMIL